MKHRQQSTRRYPRTARVNELLREIIGEELERLDDDRLQMVTVTGVECEPDIKRAVVYVDSLGGPEEDEELLTALGEVRHRLQAAINAQTRLKRTPELLFTPDPAVRSAGRIEAVLRDLPEVADTGEVDDARTGPGDGAQGADHAAGARGEVEGAPAGDDGSDRGEPDGDAAGG